MKVFEVTHVGERGVWYEGRERFCVEFQDAVTGKHYRIILDWDDARKLLFGTLTTLALNAEDAAAQKDDRTVYSIHERATRR